MFSSDNDLAVYASMTTGTLECLSLFSPYVSHLLLLFLFFTCTYRGESKVWGLSIGSAVHREHFSAWWEVQDKEDVVVLPSTFQRPLSHKPLGHTSPERGMASVWCHDCLQGYRLDLNLTSFKYINELSNDATLDMHYTFFFGNIFHGHSISSECLTSFKLLFN